MICSKADLTSLASYTGMILKEIGREIGREIRKRRQERSGREAEVTGQDTYGDINV